MAYAAQLHKLELFPGFDRLILELVGNPTPYMPPSRLRWSRLLLRPTMDPEDDEEQFEVLVLRGEMIRFGDVQIQYMWRRNENALPTTARGPARAAPRHAWCIGALSTHQDGDFFEAWRQTHNADWPYVRAHSRAMRMTVDATYVHPQLFAFFRRHANFMDAWDAVEACYIGSPEVDATTRLLGRNVWLNVQRDGALRHLREMARNLSFAWAI